MKYYIYGIPNVSLFPAFPEVLQGLKYEIRTDSDISQGPVSISKTDCLMTGRRTILLWTNSMGRWSNARLDGPSCLLKQAPGADFLLGEDIVS